MISASVGVGSGPDSFKAGAEASLQAVSGLPHKADALIVFASILFDQEKMLAGIAEHAGDAVVVGCSTAGEISSEGFSTERSVVILALASDQMQFWGGAGHHIPWNPKQAGEECANELMYKSNGYTNSGLFFFDIISGNGDLTLEGLLGRFGNNFPMYGGAAGDDLQFFQTFEYLGKDLHSGSIVGLGMSGNYTAVGVTKHGFLPVGIERHVTKSEGTTLYELDGKPAATIYEDYFGEEHAQELREGLLPSLAVAYPLGVFIGNEEEILIRNPVFVDQQGVMTFTASIPNGSEVRLMISDMEEGLATAEMTARLALEKLGGKKPRAAIIINSVARKSMLGMHLDEEIQAIQKVLGRDLPMAGFYSYAQIGGNMTGQAPFHNGALMIWLIAE